MIEQRPPALASAETWKPETLPNGKVDLNQVRDEIQARMNAQDYEGALQRQIWYFSHALEHGEVNPIRLSFGIMHWGELGRRYPKARQALVEIRDQRVGEFERGGGYSELFSEVQNVNRELGEPSATATLFRSIERRDPQLARQCYPYAESVLVEQGDYTSCLKYLGDPQARFAFLRDARERTMGMLDRMPTANQANKRKQANDTFVNECRKLVEILVGIGRTPEAQTLANQAIAVLNDPRLQSAVADAEGRVREHRPASGA
jgi:hypothetical protein